MNNEIEETKLDYQTAYGAVIDTVLDQLGNEVWDSGIENNEHAEVLEGIARAGAHLEVMAEALVNIFTELLPDHYLVEFPDAVQALSELGYDPDGRLMRTFQGMRSAADPTFDPAENHQPQQSAMEDTDFIQFSQNPNGGLIF